MVKKKQKFNPQAMFLMLRPNQWVKNGFVFAPLIFALGFNKHENWVLAFIACFAFICASSIVYIFNDIMDVKADRVHPEKRLRPLAARLVTVRQAFFTMAFLVGLMVGAVMVLPYQTWLILALYIIQNLLYTFWLKRVAIIDVLVIALGFALRVLMGGYAISVPVSPWLLIATLMLAMFLGFAKRYHEIRRLNTPDSATFGAYNMNMLDRMISVTCGASLMTYVIYTVEMAAKLHSNLIVYTVVFVIFGLFRYLQYIYYSKKGGAPEKILYNDPLFVGNIALWLLSLTAILSTLT